MIFTQNPQKLRLTCENFRPHVKEIIINKELDKFQIINENGHLYCEMGKKEQVPARRRAIFCAGFFVGVVGGDS